MTFDPVRCAEATVQAGVVFATTVLPAAWNSLDPARVLVLLTMVALLTSGVYALHAVTFDIFRLTGQRTRRDFSYTHSEE